MVQGTDQFSQAGRPQAVVPGEERLGRRLVSGLPRTDLHRINVTAAQQAAIAPPARESREKIQRLAKHSQRGRSKCSYLGTIARLRVAQQCGLELRSNAMVVAPGVA
jgi:hypothetical protein